MTGSSVKRGDRFIWAPDAPTPVVVTVTRVASDGRWADLKCQVPGSSWSKRQSLPLPDSFQAVAE